MVFTRKSTVLLFLNPLYGPLVCFYRLRRKGQERQGAHRMDEMRHHRERLTRRCSPQHIEHITTSHPLNQPQDSVRPSLEPSFGLFAPVLCFERSILPGQTDAFQFVGSLAPDRLMPEARGITRILWLRGPSHVPLGFHNITQDFGADGRPTSWNGRTSKWQDVTEFKRRRDEAPSDARTSNGNPDFSLAQAWKRVSSRKSSSFCGVAVPKGQGRSLSKKKKLKQEDQQTMKEAMREEADSWLTTSAPRTSASAGERHKTYKPFCAHVEP